MTQDNGSNQRVTNAILGTKLDVVIKSQEEIKDGMKLNTESRSASTERWKQHDKEHSALNTKKWAGDIGAALAGAAAGITAALTKS